MNAQLSQCTIRELEGQMEQALDLLRSSSETTSAAKALQILGDLRRYLAPPGYRATIQLEENGRKKRATASSSYWGFSSGEILIFYKPTANGPELVTSTPALAEAVATIEESSGTNVEEIQQCCQALAEAERGGKHFIAYKWFRDTMLAGQRYPWAATPEGRTRVLKEAVERGAVETRKIPNPKAPTYPTTTVRLVPAQNSPVKIKPRYNPIPIKGEPASVTMLRDRGSY